MGPGEECLVRRKSSRGVCVRGEPRACERRKRLFDLRLLLQIYMMRRSRRRAARWTFRKLGASEGEREKEGGGSGSSSLASSQRATKDKQKVGG